MSEKISDNDLALKAQAWAINKGILMSDNRYVAVLHIISTFMYKPCMWFGLFHTKIL